MDKIDILLQTLKMFESRTQLEINKCDTEVETGTDNLDDDAEVPEEIFRKGLYGYYLRGVLNCVQTIIGILENKDIDDLMEALERSKDNIAKA